MGTASNQSVEKDDRKGRAQAIDFAATQETEPYKSTHAVRFVTASSLFDGHDASINIMRRILQSSGAEVIHLGHNRSVEEIVDAAIQEDVQGIAVSSYQGGHVEFFKYMIDLLQERNASHIRVFAGGGGVIVVDEIKELESYGVAKIFSPDDGRRLGLQGMINHMIRLCDFDTVDETIAREALANVSKANISALAKLVTYVEQSAHREAQAYENILAGIKGQVRDVPVLGITGTGGAGKSSLTDELVRRFIRDFPDKYVAIFSIDPSKQRTGGALLGDRIRMNAIHNDRVFMRSLATRKSRSELSDAIAEAIDIAKAAGFDLIIVETSGIGQGDAEIVSISDVSLYVMTAEFGAPSQLEKIDMLDYADLVVINKSDRRGSEDALRHVRKQVQRNQNKFHANLDEMPVYGTVASQFNDPGTNVMYRALIDTINAKCNTDWESSLDVGTTGLRKPAVIPGDRVQYMLDIVGTVKNYRKFVEQQVELARSTYQLRGTIEQLKQLAVSGEAGRLGLSQSSGHGGSYGSTGQSVSTDSHDADADADVQTLIDTLERMYQHKWETTHYDTKRIIEGWADKKTAYAADEFVTKIRDKEVRTQLTTTSLSGTRISKISLPQYADWGEIVKWSMLENVPGEFPYTAGVFPFKRTEEEPRRQFAGEGTPERTNRRFHYLSEGDPAKRLSTAFDSVTLYGEDPDYRPDIYGKIGESGVSICTLDDMKKLYAGFDLCAQSTSVSMTINGPAPMILAMFMNTAIDQQLEKFEQREGRKPNDEELGQIRAYTLSTVRGTVQADILKEDQGQNTCIFSTEFALRMMGDIQQYFIDKKVRNYYSVSISGYHIAEAGANPISQLAFTLANAFTYVEYYLSRGMKIDDFAPNLSFFFSNGMDPEYTVIGRVARRIWATVMKHKYGANDRSQKLKYHIQTSGRSLHAQEIDFNDIRTTLQALLAIYDNCNSLHTNAYDEAITTPTEDSVRRAMAIQMIINREFGLTKNENPLQGAFIIDELTDLVEAAVLDEFTRINDRGGVLGAMETQYQRSKIQEESMYYEGLKHSGKLPIIGVNTFLNPSTLSNDYVPPKIELARATKDEKEQQIRNLRAFQDRHKDEAPAAIARLQQVAMKGENIFAALMDVVRVASLGQITRALYEVGGKYRRNM
ncbi:methylmalonyl-CoA mutase family protein [Alicyclobacillus dauci]|uniref:Fused isobutyryl-CoA mutase n=1 Tax=Alicyclobacillus dauci TaxID=1475485 RepID=A0ABY6Z2A7_9BACL|nr:methylmalonyl-CoA mutase family protein [Alicyclobacillus dauci]WAH36879.1 methylmalonyl-CoA mutase family protein [Alicyclobacillus dauci]